LPPLRERREDILPLARHFAERAASSGTRPLVFSREAVRLLENYDWPGNIRELENAIVRAAALCDRTIRPEALPDRVRSLSGPAQNPAALAESQPVNGDTEDLLTLAELENRHIRRVLARTSGNKQAAARILGIDRTTLQRKIERCNLNGTDLNTEAMKA